MSHRLAELAQLAGQLLTGRHLTLATAESCTGGGLGFWVTSVVGSSAWYQGGFITYNNAAKVELLDVDEKIIAMHGAVSEETAIAMAKGALHACRANIAIAITGIAGPDGGTEEKPVGTVWFAFTHATKQTVTRCLQFAGDRQQVREQAIAAALEGLMTLLEV